MPWPNSFPAPNANPNSTGGYNYTQSEVFNQNNRQWTIRGDYNISENTKLFVRYNYQREVQQFPVGLWWRNTDQVPYPSAIEGKNKSDSWSGSITHVFNSTMTNETVVAYTFVGFPNVFADPAKVNRSNVGYNYKGVYNNGVAQIPSFGNFGPSEAALVFNPGGFEAGGNTEGLFANKYMPSVSDTFTKVMGDHTLKAGFFYEWIRNAQPANDNTNGEQLVSAGNSFSYGNEYADLLTGNINSYNEASKNRINDIAYTTWEFFVQDSWKATKKLTVELGVRFSHFTPWEDREGYGYSIFDVAQFAPACAADFCGFEWHSKDPSVPVGGFPTRALFYQPRVGAAYDVWGTGRTVLRGGWGQFVYHSGQFTSGLDASAGVTQANLSPSTWVGGAGCPTNGPKGSALFVSYLSCLNASLTPSSPSAVDSTDDNQPYTQSWSVNLDQQTPFQGLMEISYVGNRSRDLRTPRAAMAATSTWFPTAPCYPLLIRRQQMPTSTARCRAMVTSWRRPTTCTPITMRCRSAGYATPAGTPSRATTPGRSPWVSFRRQTTHSASVRTTPQRPRIAETCSTQRTRLTLEHSFIPTHLVDGLANGWQLSGITQLESGANLTYGGNISNQTPNLNYNFSLSCEATASGNGCRYRLPDVRGNHPGLDQHDEPGRHRYQQPIHPGNQLADVEPAGYLQSHRTLRRPQLCEWQLLRRPNGGWPERPDSDSYLLRPCILRL